MGSFFARARRTPRYLGLILTQLVLHVFSTDVFLHVHRPNSKLLPKSSAKWMLAFYVYSVFTIDGFYVFLVRISATSELLLDHVGFLTLRIEPFFSLHPRWRTVRARLVLGKVDPSNPMTFKGFVPRNPKAYFRTNMEKSWLRSLYRQCWTQPKQATVYTVYTI